MKEEINKIETNQEELKKEPKQKEKKPKKHRIRRFFGSITNVKRWVAVSDIKTYGSGIFGIAKRIFSPKNPDHTETFEEAQKRLNLTEQDLKKKEKQFLLMSIFYLFISLVLACYLFHLLLHGHISSVLMCFSIIVAVLAYALRENFWYMQIKKRKLGCNLKDWVIFICKGAQ